MLAENDTIVAKCMPHMLFLSGVDTDLTKRPKTCLTGDRSIVHVGREKARKPQNCIRLPEALSKHVTPPPHENTGASQGPVWSARFVEWRTD